MAVNAVLGVILERTAFRPFRGVELNGLIASMGMSIVLVNIAELVWGTTPRPFETSYNEISITIGTVVSRLMGANSGTIEGLPARYGATHSTLKLPITTV